MKNINIKIKQGFLVMFAFALLMSAAVQAQAITVDPNDLVLVLYNNGTEYYQVVGRVPDLINSPPSPILISGANLTTAGPAASTLWALVSFNTTTGDFSGSPNGVTLSYNSPIPSTNPNGPGIFDSLAVWGGNVSVGSTDDATGTFPKSDPNSFFNGVDGGNGDGRLNSQLPSGTSAAGQYGQSLGLMTVGYDTTQVTNSMLTASLMLVGSSGDLSQGAYLTINAVPIPAAVILFVTGLVGLIGLARRQTVTA
jgi:hypothetical protein